MLYRISTNKCDLPITKIGIGCRTNMDLTKYGPKRKGLNHIVYIISGNGYFNGNQVTSGHGFLLYPGHVVEYYPDESDPWEYLWFSSSENSFRMFMDSYKTLGDTQIFEHNCTDNLKQLMNTIISKDTSLVSATQTLEMFLNIYNTHNFDTQILSHKRSSRLYIEYCVDFINANIHTPITVQMLSELTGVSQPYLHKIFINNLSLSPKQYILRRKFDDAVKMLMSTDMTITQIAEAIGYDVLSFSKLFRKRMQMSPTQYRELYTKT